MVRPSEPAAIKSSEANDARDVPSKSTLQPQHRPKVSSLLKQWQGQQQRVQQPPRPNAAQSSRAEKTTVHLMGSLQSLLLVLGPIPPHGSRYGTCDKVYGMVVRRPKRTELKGSLLPRLHLLQSPRGPKHLCGDPPLLRLFPPSPLPPSLGHCDTQRDRSIPPAGGA